MQVGGSAAQAPAGRGEMTCRPRACVSHPDCPGCSCLGRLSLAHPTLKPGMSPTYGLYPRARILWLEVAADSARRRAERLARALQASAPLEAYQALVQKHNMLCAEHRRWATKHAWPVPAGQSQGS
jgi:hypothetical protein